MTQDDYDEFCEVVLGFAELRARELSPAALTLYWRAVQHWPIESFRHAAEHLLRTCQWMPTPKEFEDLRRAGELTAGEAWEMVLSGAPLEPGSRAARAAAQVGGQRHVRMVDVERDLPHVQRRFMDAFDDLSDVDPVREALPQIAKPVEHIRLRGPAHISTVMPRLEWKA